MGRKSNKVSVVIPVFNCERYLIEAVESVHAQTRKPDEIIVVDDGSTDKTPELLSRMEGGGVKVLRQSHSGIGAARNRGIEESLGDLIAFLDADDLWEPHKLEWQLQVLEENPGAGIVGGMIQEFFSPDISEEVKRRTVLKPRPMPGVCASVVLVCLNVFKDVGLFDPKWRIGEFMEWFARVRAKGISMVPLPRLVAWRRVHDANTVRMAPGDRSDYFKILRSALNRRNS